MKKILGVTLGTMMLFGTLAIAQDQTAPASGDKKAEKKHKKHKKGADDKMSSDTAKPQH
jgi:hypothetical protein